MFILQKGPGMASRQVGNLALTLCSGQAERFPMNLPPIHRIIHLSLCTGPLGFLVVAYFTGPKNMTDQTIPYAAAAMGCMAAGFGFFALRLFYKPVSREFADNIAPYLTAKIIQWAVVEGAALFNGFAYFLTGMELSAGFSVALLLVLFYLRPLESEVTGGEK